MHLPLQLDRARIEAFCRKWRITELSLFGSILRPSEFGSESDVDVLVRYSPDVTWSLFDEVAMEDELREIIGRDVDLVNRRAVEKSHNWIRRQAILDSAVPFYVAR
jgi:hypothetical protein